MKMLKQAKRFFDWGASSSDLLESKRTEVVHVEFTSRCNLRCVFCHASQPGYSGRDMDKDSLTAVINTLPARKPKVVSISGHGETTIYNDWHLYCQQMLDMELPLHLISNFCKPLSSEELETLTRFKSIEISCDSNDPQLFSQLRRGGDLDTLLSNVIRLRGTAAKMNRHKLSLSFSCVVSDQNVLHLMEYVRFGLSVGVSHFNFCNLTRYPGIEGALNPNHVTCMPPELLKRADQSLTEVFQFLHHLDIPFHAQHGLHDSIKEKLQNIHDSHGSVDSPQPPPGKPIRYSASRPADMTRDCTDPWNFVLFGSKGEVLPCCWHPAIYTLGRSQSHEDVFNCTPVQQLRWQLLTASLSPACSNCPSRGWTSIDVLRKKVWRDLNPGFHKLRFRNIPELTPIEMKPFKKEFLQGWYDLESCDDIPDASIRQWRWTGKRAVCRLFNPKKNALLMIRGAVNKRLLNHQKVRIKINGALLDEFEPGDSSFFKEYRLSPGLLGDNEDVSLFIETDHTFTPAAIDPGVSDTRQLGIQVYDMFYGEQSSRAGHHL